MSHKNVRLANVELANVFTPRLWALSACQLCGFKRPWRPWRDPRDPMFVRFVRFARPWPGWSATRATTTSLTPTYDPSSEHRNLAPAGEQQPNFRPALLMMTIAGDSVSESTAIHLKPFQVVTMQVCLQIIKRVFFEDFSSIPSGASPKFWITNEDFGWVSRVHISTVTKSVISQKLHVEMTVLHVWNDTLRDTRNMDP